MRKLLITLLLMLGVSIAHAEHTAEQNPQVDVPKKYDFYWSQIPAVCSTQDVIEEWAEDKGFSPVSISYGRKDGKPDGEVLYIIVYWLQLDTNETMASVSVPYSSEVCIVFRTFDLMLNQEVYQKQTSLTNHN